MVPLSHAGRAIDPLEVLRVIRTRTAVMLLAAAAAGSLGSAMAQDDAAFERVRTQMLQRQRRVILNNDGGDATVSARELTPEGMLAARTVGLEDTHVDTIFYCTNRGTFSRHSHRSEVSEAFTRTDGRYARNVIPSLLALGTDPLQVMIDWCREHDVEIFWSERMNDQHDAGNGMLSEWKLQHPQYLVGSDDRRPPHGAWTQVDYSHQAVRDQMLAIIEEVCRNYDIDGIELDFFRHLCFFRTTAWGDHATDDETAIMTAFVRRIREMTEREGRARGRPILVAIRVPDSIPLARATGLDLETWLSEGLVDLMTGSGYFRLNPWEYLVDLGHRHGVKVYAGLSDSRVTVSDPHLSRRSQDSYRGRACSAWRAGVDGIYLFNMFNPQMEMLTQIGDPVVLAGLNKVYFATVRGSDGRAYGNPDRWIADGRQWRNLPMLTPDDPVSLRPGETIRLPLYIGDDLDAARQTGLHPAAACHVMTTGDPLTVRLNGQQLTDPTLADLWLRYSLPDALPVPGENTFELSVAAPADPDAAPAGTAEWTADAMPATPWRHGTLRKDATIAELHDGALLVADRGTDAGDYLYFSYPWNALPDRPAEAQAEVRVISGWNNLTLSNGAATERVTLYPDHIGTHYTRLRYDMDTTDRFHTYRVVIQGDDILIYVDGELRIDGRGRFTEPAAGRNDAAFGAANSPSLGEALWRSVRLTSPGLAGAQIYDLALTLTFAGAE